MRRLIIFLLLAAAVIPAAADTKLLVTVVEKRTGQPITDLKAGDFSVKIGKVERQVLECEFVTGVVDTVLMVDSSVIGEAVSSLAPALIAQLAEKEQMAIVSYDSSAELIQDFTSSQDLLRDSLKRIRFGNSPSLMDAIYATAEDGFEAANFRRVILLLTSGIDGPNRVSENEVIKVARRNGVSIYPVFMMGYGRSQMEKLARLSGGAAFSLRDLAKNVQGSPAPRIFEVIRGHYNLVLSGNLPLGDKAKVEVVGNNKAVASYLEQF